MDERFEILTAEDKTHVAYGMCVLGTVAMGATMGSIAGGQTLLGAAGGAVWGLFTCRHLQEPIRRKLFGSARLTEQELGEALLATKQQYPWITKADALTLLGNARAEATRDPRRFRC